jgi:hypothetical protein
VVNGDGTVVVHAGRRSQEVLVAAVIAPDDGAWPGPGECERAYASMSAYGVRGVDLTLVGFGDVCGHHVQPPTSIVTHTFTGRYGVYGDDTRPRRLEGTDGFYEIRLGADGTASVFAIDT